MRLLIYHVSLEKMDTRPRLIYTYTRKTKTLRREHLPIHRPQQQHPLPAPSIPPTTIPPYTRHPPSRHPPLYPHTRGHRTGELRRRDVGKGATVEAQAGKVPGFFLKQGKLKCEEKSACDPDGILPAPTGEEGGCPVLLEPRMRFAASHAHT